MKRPLALLCASACLIAAGVALTPTPDASAQRAQGLRVLGEGRNRTLARQQFPPAQRDRYDLFAVRCTKCHVMARPIAALTTGITPVSGGTFDERGIRRYVVKMMRKPNSGIDRTNARDIILFLTYVRQQVVAAETVPRRR